MMVESVQSLRFSPKRNTVTVGQTSPDKLTSSLFYYVKGKDKIILTKQLSNEKLCLNPCERDNDGCTPLLLACKNQRWTNVKTLLDHYGEACMPSAVDKKGNSAFFYAFENLEIVEKLFSYNTVMEDVNRLFSNGESVLSLLVKCGNIDIIRRCSELFTNDILNHRNYLGKTPLIIACQRGDCNIVSFLLNMNVITNVYDNEGSNALMYLIKNINETNPQQEFIDACFKLLDMKSSQIDDTEVRNYNVEELFVLSRISNIPESSYGVIRSCIEIKTGKVRILKKCLKYNTYGIMPSDIMKEILLIKKMNEKTNVAIRLLGIYIDKDECFNLVFEPLAITLYDYFNLIRLSTRDETTRIEYIFKQLDKKVTLLHHHGILHNDLKLENMMFGYDGELKLIDFGISEFFGVSPNKYIKKNYITSSYIEAPDTGIILEYELCDSNEVPQGKFTFRRNRKSYASDVYSVGVSIIQGIFGSTSKYLNINGTVYKIVRCRPDKVEIDRNVKGSTSGKSKSDSEKERKQKLVPLSLRRVVVLQKYSFFDRLMQMINVDSNCRIKRKNFEHPVSEYTSSHSPSTRLIKSITHYSSEDIKNCRDELVYIDEIFDVYKDDIITSNPKNRCSPLMKKLIDRFQNTMSYDTILNTINSTNNYSGSNDIDCVCVAFLYIFSSIFEWHVYNIDDIVDILCKSKHYVVGVVNDIIINTILSTDFKPFVLYVESILIAQQKEQMGSVELYEKEESIFGTAVQYFSELSQDETFYIWDFFQALSCFFYGTLPFEMNIRSFDIITLFKRI